MFSLRVNSNKKTHVAATEMFTFMTNAQRSCTVSINVLKT